MKDHTVISLENGQTNSPDESSASPSPHNDGSGSDKLMLEPSACRDMQPNIKLKSLIVTEESYFNDQAPSSPKKNFKTELTLVQSDFGDDNAEKPRTGESNFDENSRSSPISVEEGTLKMSDKTELLASKSDKPTTPGIDNPAFEGDSDLPNGATATDHVIGNGFHLNHNGTDHKQKDDSDFKTTEEMAEAVNLELLNMGSNVTNGINGVSVKSPNSTVINMSNPYDEYFIPVNEHHKYFRGEKLYVAKRIKKDVDNSKRSRTCCAWLVGLVVLMVAICLAVLFVNKLSNEPMPGENERRFPEGNNNIVNAGINYRGETTSTSSIPPKPPSPNELAPTPYLKRAVEGEITIEELQFTPALSDHESNEFKSLAGDVERELKNVLFNQPTLKHDAADINVRVINLTPEKVIQFRISWIFKRGIQNPLDPIDVTILKERLKEFFIKNDNKFLDSYQVSMDRIYSKYMVDDCSINNGNCSHICAFDYTKMLDFYCACPEHMEVDVTQYNCKPLSTETSGDVNEQSTSDYESQSSTKPDAVPKFEPKPIPESEPGSEPEPTSEPEPKTEPSSEREPKSEPEPSSEPQPSSEPNSELIPKSEPQPSSEPESKFEPKPTSEPEPHSEPESKSEPKLTTELEPESKSEPESTAEPKPSSEPESKSEPESIAAPEPSPEPESKSEPESTAEPKPSPEPESKSEPESTAEPKPSPEPESKSEPESSSELEPKSELEPSSEPEPKSEPESGSGSAPKSTLVLLSDSDPKSEPEPEPSTVPEPESTSEPVAEPKSEPSPSSEMQQKFNLEPMSEPKSEPESSSESELKSSSHQQSISSSIEPEPKVEAESTAKVEHESMTETSIIPESENPTKSKDEDVRTNKAIKSTTTHTTETYDNNNINSEFSNEGISIEDAEKSTSKSNSNSVKLETVDLPFSTAPPLKNFGTTPASPQPEVSVNIPSSSTTLSPPPSTEHSMDEGHTDANSSEDLTITSEKGEEIEATVSTDGNIFSRSQENSSFGSSPITTVGVTVRVSHATTLPPTASLSDDLKAMENTNTNTNADLHPSTVALIGSSSTPIKEDILSGDATGFSPSSASALANTEIFSSSSEHLTSSVQESTKVSNTPIVKDLLMSEATLSPNTFTSNDEVAEFDIARETAEKEGVTTLDAHNEQISSVSSLNNFNDNLTGNIGLSPKTSSFNFIPIVNKPTNQGNIGETTVDHSNASKREGRKLRDSDNMLIRDLVKNESKENMAYIKPAALVSHEATPKKHQGRLSDLVGVIHRSMTRMRS